jgi:hypothetical protein
MEAPIRLSFDIADWSVDFTVEESLGQDFE